jgi:hypothetical protein
MTGDRCLGYFRVAAYKNAHGSMDDAKRVIDVEVLSDEQ